MPSPVAGHDDTVGDGELIEPLRTLIDQFFPVREEEHALAASDSSVDHRRRHGCLPGARRQDEEHTPPPARDGSTKAIQRGALVWSECLHFTCERRGRRQWTDRGVARAASALAVCSWL